MTDTTNQPADLRAWGHEDLARLARAAGILWSDGHDDNLTDNQAAMLTAASHGYLTEPEPAPEAVAGGDMPLDVKIDRAATLAAAMRDHFHAGRMGEALACADWVGDLGAEVKQAIYDAHPEARPENW